MQDGKVWTLIIFITILNQFLTVDLLGPIGSSSGLVQNFHSKGLDLDLYKINWVESN